MYTRVLSLPPIVREFRRWQDATCIAVLLASDSADGGETKLPYSVDYVYLQSARGLMWAAVAKEGADSVTVRLDMLRGQPQALLGGFTSRTLRAGAKAQERHLYATEWRKLDAYR